MVSYHTSETKKQSKQWIAKGKPGSIEARVQASRTKQVILAFFDSKGLVYSYIVARGVLINANYIMVVSQGYCPGVYCGGGPGVAGRPHYHGDPALAIFA